MEAQPVLGQPSSPLVDYLIKREDMKLDEVCGAGRVRRGAGGGNGGIYDHMPLYLQVNLQRTKF
jgi:hypothetical protein